MLMLCAEWVVGCCSCPRGLQELQHAPADYTLPVSPEATAGPWPGHLLSPRTGEGHCSLPVPQPLCGPQLQAMTLCIAVCVH